MDTMLMAVTGVSLALAAGMGILLARMVREERRRSDARVQLLEQLAAGGSKSRANRIRQSSGDQGVLRHTEAVAASAAGPASTNPYIDAAAVPAPVHAHTPVAQDFSAASVPLRRTVTVQDLFHEEPEPSPWPRRFAVIGSLAAVLTLVILGWTQVRTTEPAAATPAAATSVKALELLSLRHSREGNTLTVTGLVQNPQGAAALSNVQATVFVFGPGGTFITSGRAPLDFTSLTPGEESPFVIKVPVSGEVSRYRVGFRSADDRVVAHVDRRADQVGRSF